MTRILQIFRKDARHLWPHALVFLTLMALAAIFDPTYRNGYLSTSYSLLVSFALPLACWTLVIAVIHEEKLLGDRQYWLTRPYGWKELLAAKGFFVMAFINVPLLIWHVAAFVAVGIPVWEHPPELLWRQVFFTAFYILPAAAMAALTRSFGQVILAALVVILPAVFLEAFLFRYRAYWQNIEGILAASIAAIVAIGVAGILVLQYSRRRTAFSRVVFGLVAVAIVVVTVAAGNLSGRAPKRIDASTVWLTLDSRGYRRSPVASNAGDDIVTVDIPIRVEGIPPNTRLVQSSIAFWIEGTRHPQNWKKYSDGQLHDLSGTEAWLTLSMDRNSYNAVQPVAQRIHGYVDCLAFGQPRILPLPKGHSVVVPRVGVCSDTRDEGGFDSMVCYSPSPRAALTIAAPGNRVNWIIPQGFVESGIPTSSGFQPLMRFSSQLPYRSGEIADAQLMAADPLPPIQISFEFPDIRLSDYVVGARQ